MLGHCRIVRCAIIAKNSFIYLFFAERLPRVQGQILADCVFRPGEWQRLLPHHRGFGRQVEPDSAAHHAAGGGAVLPPQVGGHAGAQLRHAKWLRQGIVAAKAQSAQIIADAKKTGEAVKADITAKAQAEAAGMIEKAHAAIEADKKAAIAELQGSVADLSVAVASRLIGEDLNDDEHRKIIERYVNEAGSFNAN